jgi:hypothetical protein
MVDGLGTSVIIAMLSDPGIAFTVRVIRPVKLEGRVAVIDVLLHEVTFKTVPLVAPAGVAVTWHPLLHSPLKSDPVMIIAPPELTTRGDIVIKGPTAKMVVSILQRYAEKYPTGSAHVPQFHEPSDVLVASKTPVPATKSS